MALNTLIGHLRVNHVKSKGIALSRLRMHGEMASRLSQLHKEGHEEKMKMMISMEQDKQRELERA